MARRKIIAGNWKMNNNNADAAKLIEELKPLVQDATKDIVVCVPFTDIERVKKAIKGTRIQLGAQNVAWADKGAFTGEISADMLNELGVKYVIIGHSERRQYFGETDETVNRRTVQALKHKLIPIVCVGETEAERTDNVTEGVLQVQLTRAFKGISQEDAKKAIIAYEPVWAIGTGKTATSQDANITIKYIRNVMKNIYDAKAANTIRIQYGGSMNAANAAELLAMPDIDGGLIGGASLKALDFSMIIKA